MHKRVVPYDKAKECLKGHKKYQKALQIEYNDPDEPGSLNTIIEELDEIAKGDNTAFDQELTKCLSEVPSIEVRAVTLAMLGTDIDNTNWG